MTNEQYEKAQEIQRKIQHLNENLSFLRTLEANDSEDVKAELKEVGFISHPKSRNVRQYEIEILIKAYEAEINILEFAFKRL